MRPLLLVALLLGGCRAPRDAAPDAAPRAILPNRPAETMPADTITPTPADTSPVVFFVVKRNDFAPWIDPVMIVGVDTLEEPPSAAAGDPQRAEFVTRWYGRGQTYRLFAAGAEVGTVVAGPDQEPGCVAVSADARIEPATARSHQVGIATNSRAVRSRPAAVRQATPEESRELLRLALAALPHDAPGSLRRLETSQALAFDGGGTTLVGTFTAVEDSGEGREANVLVVAERRGGAWLPLVAQPHVSHEGNRERHVFLDVLDVTGDPTPEIFLEVFFYESTSYRVLSRSEGRWRRLWSGGGGGC